MKKLAKADHALLKKLEKVIETLRLGKTLALSLKDHALSGRLTLFRECHIAPDWLLIYRKDEGLLLLELVSTGSHAELFD